MADYPITAYHFLVEWGGSYVAFTECSGLDSMKRGVQDYREGDSPEFFVTKIPGMLEASGEFTAKRGVYRSGDLELLDWFNQTQMDIPERRDLTVSLLDEAHSPVMTWTLRNCWVTKWTGPSLNASSSDIASMEVSIVYEEIIPFRP